MSFNRRRLLTYLDSLSFKKGLQNKKCKLIQMKNVIKRSDLEYNIKDGWYCEVKKTLPHGGNKANEG